MSLQLSIDFSPRQAGQEAADRCLAKAERVASFDSEGCQKFIVGWLIRHGEQSGELLTDAAKAHGFKPHDDRAFGSVYKSLVRKNRIRCVGFCMRAKGHACSGGRVWAAIL